MTDDKLLDEIIEELSESVYEFKPGASSNWRIILDHYLERSYYEGWDDGLDININSLEEEWRYTQEDD